MGFGPGMTQEDDEAHNRLIVEQLEHTLDLIRAEISTLRAGQEHQEEMTSLRLKTLEDQTTDFEKRLRELTESATQFKLMVSLAVGGGLLSLIELVRSLLSP
jgi:chaperonin cofactor prefoldin